MSIFDVLSGRVAHANDILVPEHNRISRRLPKEEITDEVFFLAMVLDVVAVKGMSLFVQPPSGLVSKRIKEYDTSHVKQLYALFMIWTVVDIISIEGSMFDSEALQKELRHCLDISGTEYETYVRKLKHDDPASGIKKLWNEVCGILGVDSDNTEWYLTFHTALSRILHEAYSDFASKI